MYLTRILLIFRQIYQKLIKSDPTFMDRIIVVDGSLDQPGSGIVPSLLSDIINDVNIIIHAASDVRFDRNLLELINVNLYGTLQLLKLSEQIKNLELFMYISTAYSHCVKQNIKEEFYPPPIDPILALKLSTTILSDSERYNFEILTGCLIRPWPNTYAYTKALSEEIVRRFQGKFPIAVIRPSISKFFFCLNFYTNYN